MEAQLRRTYAQFGRQADDLGKNVYLANLRDRNEVLPPEQLKKDTGLAEASRQAVTRAVVGWR